MRMNDEPLLFNTSNIMSRRDAMSTLEEFGPKFRWNKINNLKVIVVGCGDGSVTDVLRKYLPKEYELIACDMGENMIKYAGNNYGNEKTTFTLLDITDELPKEIKENFEFVYSSFAFHWIPEQEKGFQNIYNLLVKGGECFVTLVAYSPIYHISIGLSRTEKWNPYMQEVHKMLSPYYDTQAPDLILKELMKKVGFCHVDVKCRQSVMNYKHDELEMFISALNPFKFPNKNVLEEFKKDYINMAQKMQLEDPIQKSIKITYNILIIHCVK